MTMLVIIIIDTETKCASLRIRGEVCTFRSNCECCQTGKKRCIMVPARKWRNVQNALMAALTREKYL